MKKKSDYFSSDIREEVKPLKAGLYLVATPIGNLKDITLRALELLRGCDTILCEDTRVTRKLLDFYGIRKSVLSYHDHSDDTKRERIVDLLKEGKVVCLVSDAGMPLISDPGFKLVQDCISEGIFVTSLPGANAPLAALQLSGLPSDRFCFLGFLPVKGGARKEMLEAWAEAEATLIFFETAPRLLATLEAIREVFGSRKLAVVREITKLFEEVRRGTADELIAYYESEGLPKGEIVLLAGPAEKTGAKKLGDKEIEKRLRGLLARMKTKEAAYIIAEEAGISRKEAYDLAVRLSKE